MPQVSSDVHMLLPVLVAVMVAKWVADAATHSLYHGLLEVRFRGGGVTAERQRGGGRG